MLIYDHAVDKYIMRILNHDPENIGENVREFVEKQIIKVYENPDEIRSMKKNMPPFYIKDNVALIVANKKEKIGNNTIYKYERDGGDIIIPTVYTKEMAYNMEEKEESHKQKGIT